MPPEATITAPAESSKSPTTSRPDFWPRSTVEGASTLAGDARHRAVRSVTMRSTRWRNFSTIRPAATCSRTRRSNGSTTPGPVPQVMWKRGTELPWPSASAAAALGPADHRKPAHAHAMQPGPHLAGGEVDIGLGHLARPEILGPVEAGRAHPVLQRQLAAVLDAHAPLLGAVDEEQPAQRPEGLAAERVFALLFEDRHASAGVRQFGRCHQPGKPRADHDGIRLSGMVPPFVATNVRWNVPAGKAPPRPLWVRETGRDARLGVRPPGTAFLCAPLLSCRGFEPFIRASSCVAAPFGRIMNILLPMTRFPTRLRRSGVMGTGKTGGREVAHLVIFCDLAAARPAIFRRRPFRFRQPASGGFRRQGHWRPRAFAANGGRLFTAAWPGPPLERSSSARRP